ncbi:MAG: hypothetical protein JNN24_11605 [Hyphomicrobium zavarzinii]|jgi:hypothetical protein|uniref:hypothetical protein n=1 Tax=Hyphomicrobium TaxID=81 RepID=UPI00037475BC|nr:MULTISPECIES: hypothetical protein [Hyphomicrobium]MBL8846404.1 hypothetical protein [Hyphomicrobium zavarzinii]WBT36600.1 hypothetical protein PE058_13150 [Hyphomicrobium sp. DMF-1]HML43124.1 hypothetical protein [Hyphomicrobium zavarzinii]
MTRNTARNLLVFALAPLVLMGSLRSSPADSVRNSDDVRLELAALKGEARSLVVHIDGP